MSGLRKAEGIQVPRAAADNGNMSGEGTNLRSDRAEPAPVGAERRKLPRYGCAGDAEIVAPGCGLRFAAQIVNLSAGGCFLGTKCRLERGTLVEICMKAEGLPLRVAANLLAWSDKGAAFRFHGVSARKLAQIEILIAELEAERKAKAPPATPQ